MYVGGAFTSSAYIGNFKKPVYSLVGGTNCTPVPVPEGSLLARVTWKNIEPRGRLIINIGQVDPTSPCVFAGTPLRDYPQCVGFVQTGYSENESWVIFTPPAFDPSSTAKFYFEIFQPPVSQGWPMYMYMPEFTLQTSSGTGHATQT